MRGLSGLFVWVLVLAFGRTPVYQSESGAVDDPQLAKIQIGRDIRVENQPVLWILQDVLRGTGVPGGFAEIAGCSDLPKGSLNLKQGTTVLEAMDALVAANPSYQWQLKDGVVDLIPWAGVPLLDLTIARFQMDATDDEIPIVFQNLLRQPEVRVRETQLGLKPALRQGGPGVVDEQPVPRRPASIHIHLLNLSLRGAFNKIVRTSSNVIWMYREIDCNGNRTYTVEVTSDH